MANKIFLKKSSVAGKIPAAEDLDYGELALNYTDGNLFYKSNANVVTTLVSTQYANVSGNITGGNIITAGQVSATGNITGNYFIGNGSLLTGVNADKIGGNITIFTRSSGNVNFDVIAGYITILTRTGNVQFVLSP